MSVARLAVLAVLLAVPATAEADGLDALQRLAGRNLEPRPLVPTSGPPILRPLMRTVGISAALRKQGYGIRMVHYAATGPDAIIALNRGDYRSMGAARTDFTKRQGFKAKRTRVRGKPGFVLTRRLGPTVRYLLWAESGQVYTMGSGTPKKISLADLRGVAAGLDVLERDYLGSVYDQDTGNSFDAVLVSTRRTVSGFIEFSGTCTMPNGFAGAAHAGQAGFYALPRQGNSFSVPFAADIVTPAGWSGTITGAVSPGAITVTGRATGSFDGAACDTGPFTVTADQRVR
jgi:hypothetical protein